MNILVFQKGFGGNRTERRTNTLRVIDEGDGSGDYIKGFTN